MESSKRMKPQAHIKYHPFVLVLFVIYFHVFGIPLTSATILQNYTFVKLDSQSYDIADASAHFTSRSILECIFHCVSRYSSSVFKYDKALGHCTCSATFTLKNGISISTDYQTSDMYAVEIPSENPCEPVYKTYCESHQDFHLYDVTGIPFKCVCLRIVENYNTWTGSQSFCNTFPNGRLYGFNTVEGLITISMIPDNFLIWVGMSDIATEGVWTLTDGRVLSNAEILAIFREGEPNNVGGEHCARYEYQSGLNDCPCDDNLRSVCEIPLT